MPTATLPTETESLLRRLRHAHVMIVAAIALLALLGQAITLRSLNHDQNGTVMAETAGRIASGAQELIADALIVSTDDQPREVRERYAQKLDTKLSEWDALARQFAGSFESQMPPPARHFLRESEDARERLRERLQDLLKTSRRAIQENERAAGRRTAQIVDAEERFLAAYAGVRGEVNRLVHQRLDAGRYALWATLFAMFFALALEGHYLFRPTLGHLGRAMRIEQRTRELRAANQELARLASTDALTSLPNRRALHEALVQTASRSRLTQRPLAILMADLDHFKMLNDAYGHAVGDEALRLVASVLLGTIRNTDLAARYGGEEFAAVLPDVTEEQAMEVAERFRRSIEGLPWDRGTLRVSVGVAVGLPEDDGEALLHSADTALYAAKRNGRNRLEVASPQLRTGLPG